MLLSKLAGLLRDKVLANYLGVAGHADVLRAALRAANNLQNLLGEQALSAAFVPIYARLLAEGREREARRFAGAIFGLLVALVSILVLVCVLAAPWIAWLTAWGFHGDAAEVAAGTKEVDRFALLVRALRLAFPMTGILVLSAWALAVLNGHRRFFLSYLAPVLWNGSMISLVLVAAWRSGYLGRPNDALPATLEEWLFAAILGALIGGALQFLVQVPLVVRLSGGFEPSLDFAAPGVRTALKAFWPALAGRGVVQLSLYVDLFLCTLLRDGATAAVGFAAGLVNLVMGVFGMSVAAVELPELSTENETHAADRLIARIERAVRQSLFVVLPAVVGYLAFGFLVVVLTLRGGRFGVGANWLVYLLLVAYSVGLPASTVSRLVQNAFFALGDTKTPARIALARLALSGSLGALLMLQLDTIAVADLVAVPLGEDPLFLGAVGLGLASGLGAWFELLLLRHALRRRLPTLRLPWTYGLGRIAISLIATTPALALWLVLAERSVYLQAAAVLPTYMLTYLAYALWRREPEIDLWLGRVGRR
jgi:putative peptidoglycan lipid II flippase